MQLAQFSDTIDPIAGAPQGQCTDVANLRMCIAGLCGPYFRNGMYVNGVPGSIGKRGVRGARETKNFSIWLSMDKVTAM